MTLTERISTIRKAIVALVGVLGTVLSANLLPADVAGWLSSALGIVTVLLTYWVPNADVPGKHEAPGYDA